MVWPLLAAYMAASAGSSLGKGRGLSQVPLIGGFFDDPAQQKLEDSMRVYGMEAAARAPLVRQQWENLRGQVDQAYAPARTALAQIYAGTPVQQSPQPMDPGGAFAPGSVPKIGGAYPSGSIRLDSQGHSPGGPRLDSQGPFNSKKSSQKRER